MKRRLTGIMALFTAVILGITAYFYISDRAADAGDIRSGQIVAANEIEQLFNGKSKFPCAIFPAKTFILSNGRRIIK